MKLIETWGCTLKSVNETEFTFFSWKFNVAYIETKCQRDVFLTTAGTIKGERLKLWIEKYRAYRKNLNFIWSWNYFIKNKELHQGST